MFAFSDLQAFEQRLVRLEKLLERLLEPQHTSGGSVAGSSAAQPVYDEFAYFVRSLSR